MTRFFLLAYAISWLIWAPLWLPELGMSTNGSWPILHPLGGLGPMLSAFICTALESGKEGTRALWRRMAFERGTLGWVLLALFAPLLLLALGMIIHPLFGGPPAAWGDFGRSRDWPMLSAPAFLLFNLIFFGYGEEVGWRGYALPRLQAGRSAWQATVILTLFWAMWHAPLFFFRPGFAGMDALGVVGWLFSLLTGAVLLTWLFNDSRGNLLVVALLHASIDVAFVSVTSAGLAPMLGAAVTCWGIWVLIVFGPARLARAGKVVKRPGMADAHFTSSRA